MDVLKTMFSGGNMWEQYFSFRGRMPQAMFWFRFFMLNIFVNILTTGLESYLEDKPNVNDLPFLYVIYAAWWVSLSSLWMRRMQDRNVSGLWYIAVAVLAPAALFFRMRIWDLYQAGDPAGAAMNVPSIIFGALVFLIGCGIFVVFGFFRGTVGENRFGPDPLEDREPVKKAVPVHKGKRKH